MRIRTGGKVYEIAALTRPTIRHYMDLQKVTRALGNELTSADVFRLEEEFVNAKTDEERNNHPGILTFMALVVWATLIEEGVTDPWDKAIDTRLDDLEFVLDPQDHAAPKKPRAARASARGARRPAAAKRAAAKTSKETSTSAS